MDFVKGKPKLKSSEKIKNIYPESKFLLQLQKDETPFEYLDLSVRPFNALKRSGISTVGDLASLFLENEIKTVRNIGNDSIREIGGRLKDFCENSEKFVEQVNIGRTENLEEISSSLFIDIELLKRVSTIPLNKIPIDRLVLSKKSIQGFNARNINSIGDFDIQNHLYKNFENIKFRLKRYLNWIAEQDQKVWENEVENKGLSPLHFALLSKTNLDDLVEKWFHALNDNARYVIRSRYGFTSTPQTLQETADSLGVTRERVRQIQHSALNKLHSRKCWMIIEPLVALYLDWIQKLGGLIKESQLIKYTSAVAPNTRSSHGVATLILELEKSTKWIKHTEAWGHSSFPLHKIEPIQQKLEKILELEKTGIHKKSLLSQLLKSDEFIEDSKIIPKTFFFACLSVNPRIEIDDDGECKLSKWSGRRLDEMICALREIGEPVHFSILTERTNSLHHIVQLFPQ